MEVNKQFSNACDSEELGITRQKPKHPRYAVVSQRLDSFKTWPNGAPVSSESLAEAGFVYTGKEDAVRCFYCDGGLKSWQRGDDPWVEHANYYPKCPYVLLVKGQAFIGRITGRLESDISGAKETTGSEDNLGSVAALSCLQMGFSEVRVLKAIKTYIESYGSSDYRGEDLCELLLSDDSDQGDVTEADLHQNEAGWCTNISDGKVKELQDDKDYQRQSDEALHEENRRLKENQICKICLDGLASVIFLPCGHMVTCPQCAPAFTTCPICRVEVSGIVKAFFTVS